MHGAQVAGRSRRGSDAVAVGSLGAANRKADAMGQQRTTAAPQPVQRLSGDVLSTPTPAHPQRLRLDLDNVDQVRDSGPQLIERAEGNDADTEVEPRPRHARAPDQPNCWAAGATGLRSSSGVTTNSAICLQLIRMPELHSGQPNQPNTLAWTFWNESRLLRISGGTCTVTAIWRGGSGCGLRSAMAWSFLCWAPRIGRRVK